MTHRREPTSTNAITIDALHRLPSWLVDMATGKTASALYKVANPTNRYGLHFDDAAALEAALIHRGEPSVFAEVFRRRVAAKRLELGAAQQGEDPDSGSMAGGVFALIKEMGEYADAVNDAEAHGKYTVDELTRMHRELSDLKAVVATEAERIWRRLEAIKMRSPTRAVK